MFRKDKGKDKKRSTDKDKATNEGFYSWCASLIKGLMLYPNARCPADVLQGLFLGPVTQSPGETTDSQTTSIDIDDNESVDDVSDANTQAQDAKILTVSWLELPTTTLDLLTDPITSETLPDLSSAQSNNEENLRQMQEVFEKASPMLKEQNKLSNRDFSAEIWTPDPYSAEAVSRFTSIVEMQSHICELLGTLTSEPDLKYELDLLLDSGEIDVLRDSIQDNFLTESPPLPSSVYQLYRHDMNSPGGQRLIMQFVSKWSGVISKLQARNVACASGYQDLSDQIPSNAVALWHMSKARQLCIFTERSLVYGQLVQVLLWDRLPVSPHMLTVSGSVAGTRCSSR